MKRLLIYLLLLSSCISEYNAKLPASLTHLLVVQGNIIGDTVCIFNLTRTYPINNDEEDDFDWNFAISMKIVDSNGGSSEPATALPDGTYAIQTGKLDPNLKYALQIEADGEIYRSEMLPPLDTPDIDSISFAQQEGTGDVSIRVSTHNKANSSGFYMWRYIEDWETRAYYNAPLTYDRDNHRVIEITLPNPRYYCWKNNKINAILIGSTNSYGGNEIVNEELYSYPVLNDRFSTLYSVIVYQMALSRSGYEYYLANRKYNQEMGGLFTPQPSEIQGNITCISNPDKKMIGFVDVIQNVTHKRLYIYESQVVGYNNRSSLCKELTVADLYELFETRSYDDFYDFGFRPVSPGESANSVGTWTYEYCTDCTMNGGSKTKPSFWPNDHF
ncbi:MAG: DUF4249 domain-containing protein [Tannerella sp.]|jgi:hypothetical protein|nr:DUF4249 domain-containing protein [Tannerella sp.]